MDVDPAPSLPVEVSAVREKTSLLDMDVDVLPSPRPVFAIAEFSNPFAGSVQTNLDEVRQDTMEMEMELDAALVQDDPQVAKDFYAATNGPH
jgi:hypothetical protein